MITKQALHTAQSLAPLLSEGAISPFQVSNMSKREKAQREQNIQARYKIEYQFKRENMTNEEKDQENRENVLKEIENLKIKIESTNRIIAYHKELKSFQSSRMNDTKRAVLIDEAENKEREIKLYILKGGILKNE